MALRFTDSLETNCIHSTFQHEFEGSCQSFCMRCFYEVISLEQLVSRLVSLSSSSHLASSGSCLAGNRKNKMRLLKRCPLFYSSKITVKMSLAHNRNDYQTV